MIFNSDFACVNNYNLFSMIIVKTILLFHFLIPRLIQIKQWDYSLAVNLDLRSAYKQVLLKLYTSLFHTMYH